MRVKGRLEGRVALAPWDAHWRGARRQLGQAEREKTLGEISRGASEASVSSK